MATYKQTTDILPDTEYSISDAGIPVGAITTFSLSGNGNDANKTAGVYTFTKDHELITNGKGRNFQIRLAVDNNGAVTTDTTLNDGYGYAVGDTLTIDGARFGGVPAANNIVLTVTSSVSTAGQTTQGYKTVSLKATQPIMEHRANSGRTIKINNSYQLFEAKVSYNKLVKSDFNKLYNFLLEKQGTLKAFRMSLPQHQPLSRVNKEVNPLISASASAGATSLSITKITSGTDANLGSGNITTTPVVGNILTVDDSNNSTHNKTYIITRIDSSTENLSGNANTIYISPPLQKDITISQTNFGQHLQSIVLNRPLMRVSLTSNDLNYSIDSSGLYTLSFSVREDLS